MQTYPKACSGTDTDTHWARLLQYQAGKSALQPLAPAHRLEARPVVQLHHCVDLQRTVVGDFGVLHNRVPLVQLSTAR